MNQVSIICLCCQLFSDTIIGFPEDRASKIISQVSSAPLYYYRFSYQGRYSTVYQPQTEVPYGMSWIIFPHYSRDSFLILLSASQILWAL
jgi:hypothetical protein